MPKTGWLVAVLLLGGSCVYAQSVPVTATITLNTDVYSSGQKVASHVRVGNYYRRSDGSVLEQWESVDGDASKAAGILSLAGGAASYTLNYATRTAVQGPASSAVNSAMPAKAVSATSSSQQSNVGGIPCILSPVKPQGASHSGPGSAVGQACVATKYNLVLRRDLTYTGTDGRTYHEVYVMSPVQPNVAPNPNLFDLAAQNFTIQSR
jgi:hypothetical protein